MTRTRALTCVGVGGEQTQAKKEMGGFTSKESEIVRGKN
jgi:hypothetical protein